MARARDAWRPSAASSQRSAAGGASSRNDEGEPPANRQRVFTDQERDKTWAAGPDPPPKTRRGRRRGPKTDQKFASKNDGLKTVLALLAKQTLANAQQIRTISALTIDVSLGPKESPIVTALIDEQEIFAQAAEDNRKFKRGDEEWKDLGPPTASAFVALTDAPLSMDAGAVNKDNIKAAVDELTQQETPQLAIEQVVGLCRLAKTADPARSKLLLGIKMFKARASVVEALRQVGFIHMRGAAPPGHMEEEIQDWLEALTAE